MEVRRTQAFLARELCEIKSPTSSTPKRIRTLVLVRLRLVGQTCGFRLYGLGFEIDLCHKGVDLVQKVFLAVRVEALHVGIRKRPDKLRRPSNAKIARTLGGRFERRTILVARVESASLHVIERLESWCFGLIDRILMAIQAI